MIDVPAAPRPRTATLDLRHPLRPDAFGGAAAGRLIRQTRASIPAATPPRRSRARVGRPPRLVDVDALLQQYPPGAMLGTDVARRPLNVEVPTVLADALGVFCARHRLPRTVVLAALLQALLQDQLDADERERERVRDEGDR